MQRDSSDWMKHRFNVPFSGETSEEFFAAVEPFKEYIHSIYLGCESVFPQGNTYHPHRRKAVLEFVNRHAHKLPVLFTMNITLTPEQRLDIHRLMMRNHVLEFIRDNGIRGIIVTEPSIARVVNDELPNVEIHTSINVLDDDPLDEHGPWAGIKIDYINLLRNDGYDLNRVQSRTARAHAKGIQTKLMVNANCVRRCPFTQHHLALDTLNAMGQLTNEELVQNVAEFVNLDQGVLATIRNCLILPRWLPTYAGAADVLKIDGKGRPAWWIANCLEAYIDNRDDVLVGDLTDGICWFDELDPDLSKVLAHIPVKLIPDELRTCCAKRCSTCTVCSDSARRVKIYLHLFKQRK